METNSKPSKLETEINCYVIAALFVVSIFYSIGASVEPGNTRELEFFETSLMLSFVPVVVFGAMVTKRYWHSKVFGRAYLSLTIGYALYFVGWVLWYVYQIIYDIANPYPYYPDIFFYSLFPFSIYHLHTNIHYFKRKLNLMQKFVIVSIPVAVTSLYLAFGYFPFELPSGLFSATPLPIPEYDMEFYTEYFVGAAYVFGTTLVLSYAIIGTQVFRGTILGHAWGLLLAGFAMKTFADIPYYYSEVTGSYDPSDPTNALWLTGNLIVCYALYKHKDL
ncbi:MAG: hypothetical protein ACT4OW_04375 [Nitrososphaerota archaeon]